MKRNKRCIQVFAYSITGDLLVIFLLTCLLWRPFKPAILFSTTNRRTSWHAFRFLKVLPVAVSTRHSWLWQMWDDVYTRNCFSESEGTRFGAPRTKGTAVNEWVHSFVDFCLIPYPQPIPLTFQPQICKDGFISIVFDVSPECCLFDRVWADNWPVLRSLQRY